MNEWMNGINESIFQNSKFQNQLWGIGMIKSLKYISYGKFILFSIILGLYLFQIVFVGKEETHAKAVFFPLRLLCLFIIFICWSAKKKYLVHKYAGP